MKKISVKEVGVGVPVNPYADIKNKTVSQIESAIEFAEANLPLPALDTNGNKLPVGEYEAKLVELYTKVLNKNETRQVYVATVALTLESLSTGKSNWQEKAEARQQANKQPEKEVDTIEQAAEGLYPTNGVSAGKLVLNNNKKEGFIAGANHIKASHVPIEEVEKIIDEMVNKNGLLLHHPEKLKDILRSLIKPQ